MVALILSLLILDPAASEGCGDKFQRVGRGARFQRGYVALYPACVLLYARPQSPISKAFRDLEPALKRAGHAPLLVDKADALGPALKTAHYAVVLTEPGEVATIEAQARAVALPVPSILPVLHRPTREAKASAEKQFSCVVEAPGRQVDVLAEIDGLMERRLKAGAVSPAPKK
ncbi:MAG TPA: hypothetical protein VFM29_07955 [Vicinamibacteria bacterium]|nr:hypothetical protein [Vicinamibacteria bacterium]